MRTLRLLGLSPVLLCIAAAPPAAKSNGQQMANAAQSAVPTVSAASPAPKVNERKICKELPQTGSRLPNRACLTKKEWDELKNELDQY